MKILTALALVVFSWSSVSDGIRCFTRQEKKFLRALNMKMKCSKPTEQMIFLPVPPGYDLVKPSMQKAAMCSNLMCWKEGSICGPTKTKKRSFKVEAWTTNPPAGTCTSVEVEEHLECGCICKSSEDDCNDNQEFDESTCRCKCKEEFECSDGKMQDFDTCSCICPDGATCD